MTDQPDGQRVDRRIQRTRHMLRDALLTLIEERGYDGLSVQDITERANIGRTTFYEHYADKEQLLFATLRELAADMEQRMRPLTTAEIVMDRQTMSVIVFEHVGAHRRLYRALLSERGAMVVMAQLRSNAATLARQYVVAQLLADATHPLPATLVEAHAGGSLLALVNWWLESDSTYTPTEMGALFWRFMHEGLSRTLGIEITQDHPHGASE